MKGRLLDMARNLDPEGRVAGRGHGNSPQALGVGQGTAGSRTIERLEIETSLGERRRTVASGRLQGTADGFDPGSQRGSDALTVPGLCQHVWYSLRSTRVRMGCRRRNPLCRLPVRGA